MGTGVSYTVYQFTEVQLKIIHDFMELSPWGPRDAYCWFKGLKSTESVRTGEVEDFACAFYTQYNRTYGRTY